MKKKILLPILLLATMSLGGGLIGCNKKPAESQTSTQSQYKVAIDNKAALEGEWYEGDAKDLELTLTPEANALQELNNKNLTVTSSDETVVKVTGLGLSALKEGTAKITVDYRGAKEEVNVTILSKSAKKKYGVAHEGTAEDPFTNEDALIVAAHPKYADSKEDFYVKGEVASWYHAPGERTDGVVSFFLKPATAGGKQFEIYKCLKEDGKTALTEKEIWKGGIVTAHGTFTEYSGQYETSSAKFVKCEGTVPGDRQTLTSTVAEAVTKGAALPDGDSEYDYYNITGYVVKKSGDNYFLSDTKEAAGKDTEMFELFGAKADGLADKLLKNAKITVKATIKNYHKQVETCLPLTAADVTVVEAGQPWVINYQEKTVAEALAVVNALEDGKTADGYFAVTGVVAAVTGAYSEEYKNMTFTIGDTAEDTSLLTVFRFKTDAETAAKIVAGTKVIAKGQLQKYKDKNNNITPELININEVEIIPGEDVQIVSLAKYDFVSKATELNTRSIDAATATGLFHKLAGEDIFTEVSEVTNVYEGANGGKDDTAWTLTNILKLGKGSGGAGRAVIKLNKDVTKVVVKGDAWTATNSLTINGKAVADAFKENVINKAAITDGKLNNTGTLEFEFSATKEITIETGNSKSNANCGIIFDSIEFFGPGSATPASNITFKWADALQAGSSALDGAKFNKNATYTFKVTAPVAGTYVLTLPMMGSDGNGAKTFCTTGTANDGQGFTIAVGETAGTILVSGKTYTEVFGENQKAWVNVAFAEIALAAGENTFVIKTNGGGYRVSVNVNSDITLAPKAA